ncbi:hypothetical protein PVAP13_5KG207014 [Panicum virgatum]|uniref:Uncharacterized protein n=1 Tax=Panicum virgatum TaxID=38727 RepID=A0A8T0SJ05_PANVG|nr:hypothetical protein PVAP13_5KG207014 [Panicum virgatum]
MPTPHLRRSLLCRTLPSTPLPPSGAPSPDAAPSSRWCSPPATQLPHPDGPSILPTPLPSSQCRSPPVTPLSHPCAAVPRSLLRSTIPTTLDPPDGAPKLSPPPSSQSVFRTRFAVPHVADSGTGTPWCRPPQATGQPLRRSHDSRLWPPRSLTSVQICFARS